MEVNWTYTLSAKTELINNIRSTFIESVNKEALKQLNSMGKKLETDKPQILQLKYIIPEAMATVDSIKNHISKENSNSENLQKYLSEVQTDLPKLSQQINNLHDIVAQERILTLSTKQSINSAQSDLDKDINEIESKENQLQLLLNNLQNIDNQNIGASSASSMIDNLNGLNNSLIDKVNTDISILNTINEIMPVNSVGYLIDSLESLKNSLNTEKGYLIQLKMLINSNSSKDNINGIINQLFALSMGISTNISNVSDRFYSGIYEAMNLLSDELEVGLDSIDSALDTTQNLVPELNVLANSGISNSKNLINQRNKLDKKLTDIQNKLNKLSGKIKDLNNKYNGKEPG